MKYADAMKIAHRVIARLEPLCERGPVIAGSLRRGRETLSAARHARKGCPGAGGTQHQPMRRAHFRGQPY